LGLGKRLWEEILKVALRRETGMPEETDNKEKGGQTAATK
jgi:hypothetical protein